MFDAPAARDERWRAWRMDELARAPADACAPAAHTATRPAKPDQAQAGLRDLHAQAREAGHAEGYAAGLAEGRAAGLRQGLDEGREAGTQEFDERRRQLLEPLAPLATGLRHALDELDAEIGDALVDVALAVGHKLAGDALDVHPEQVRTLIRGLLHEEPLFSGHPCLRLHPDDAALVESALADDLAAAGWKVKADASVERGGCRLTGAEGELNATRETRWLAMLARVRRRGSAPIRDTAAQDTEPSP